MDVGTTGGSRLVEELADSLTLICPRSDRYGRQCGYTIRHITFWPPDRSEADGLDAGHPLHTLRRLIDAPLPLPTEDPRADW